MQKSKRKVQKFNSKEKSFNAHSFLNLNFAFCLLPFNFH